MDPNSQIDMPPKRRRLWIIAFALLVVGSIVVAVVQGMDARFTSAPFAIQFAPSPTNKFVPQFDITNINDFAVCLTAHLECQTNGTWTSWPPTDTDRYETGDSYLPKNAAKTGWYVSETPLSNTSVPLRLCGYVGKEKVGLARFANNLRRCWYFRGNTNVSWKTLWNRGCTPFHTPITFCSSPFYLTNAVTPLAITMGEEVVARR